MTTIRRLALLLCLLSGCNREPVIDTTTDASTDASVKAVGAALPEADRPVFARAMGSIVLREQLPKAFAGGFSGKAAPQPSRRELLASLNGLTGRQVIERAGRTSGTPAAASGARQGP